MARSAIRRGRKSKLHECLARSLRLLTYLCEHRFGGTIHDLTEEIGLSQRQLYHYLEAFESAGIPIERNKGDRWTGPGRVKLRDRRWVMEKLGVI